MSWTRATFEELLDQARADFASKFSAVTYLRRVFEAAAAYVQAGMTHHLHGHLEDNARQAIPDTADEEQFGRWATAFGVPPNGAQKSTGAMNVTGAGGDLDAGEQFYRDPDGALYTVDDDHTAITASTPVAVTALIAGADGDLGAGATLTAVSPISGIDSEATVAAGGITGGLDAEDLDDHKERFFERLQRSPRGGTPGDHEEWAKEVDLVTRAWAYKGKDGVGNPGAGRMAVTFVLDDPDTGDVTIPDSAKVAEVQAYLDARSPLEVIAFAPTSVPYAYAAAVTGATAEAVDAEMADMLKREAIPGGTIYLSSTNEAISAAEGETSHTLSAPVADKTHAFGELATFVAGTIT